MNQTGQDRPSVLRAARERTRAEITREILDAARRHLAHRRGLRAQPACHRPRARGVVLGGVRLRGEP